LVPPAGRVALLARRHLFERLAVATAEVPATLVSAAAGYGKTEFAASLHRAVEAGELGTDVAACWYTLDELDRDPAVFLTHLAAALEPVCPGTAERAREVLTSQGGGSGVPVGMGALINEIMEASPRRVVVVFDDVHEVADSEPVRDGLELLLRRQPPNLHLVLLSRRPPELASLPRMRATGRLFEIDERDLRLTLEETGTLFGDVYGLELDEATAEGVHAATNGWLAALQLVHRYLRDRPGSEPPDPADPLPDMFEYLGAEVLAGEPEEIVAVLMRSSVLDRISGPLCDALAEHEGSLALLEEAHRRRLFVDPLEGEEGWFRVHPLFREFLRGRLETTEGPDGVAEMHRRAARHLEAGGELEAAADHYLEAGDHDSTARIVETVGPQLLTAGRLSRIGRWLERTPETAKDDHPALWLLEGRLSYIRGEASPRPFERAQARFEAEGDGAGVSAALRGRAGAHFRRGQYDSALRAATEARDLVGPEQHGERAEVSILLGMITSEMGDPASAEAHLDDALGLLREIDDVAGQARALHNLATVHLQGGRLRRALAADERALELLPSATDPLRAAILVTLGWARRLLGEVEEAWNALAELQTLCDRLDLPLHRCYALCLEGDLLVEEGAVDAAGHRYASAQSLGRQLGEPSMRVQPWIGMARAARIDGDAAAAIEAAERAVREAREVGYDWYVGMALTELGAARALAGDGIEALDRLDEAASTLEERDARYDLAVCRLRQAVVLGDLGRDPIGPLEECLAVAQAEGYEHLLVAREAATAIPLLADALRAGIRTDYAVRMLARSGRIEPVEALLGDPVEEVRLRAVSVLREMADRRALTALAAAHADTAVGEAARSTLDDVLSREPPTLRVVTLGSFGVWRGDEPIDASEWGGSRVKNLFKLLVIHRLQPVVRDVVVEALWPDLPADTALNNLNVTMSTLRRVLEPWLPPRRSSSYILTEEGTYRLVPGTYSVDADRFAEAALQVQARADAEEWGGVVEAARAALEAYAGPFLPENRYDDWAVVEAERLANLHGDVLVTLARAYAALDRLEEACAAARELLVLEPFAEEVHRLLMRCLARRGRRAEALLQYEECRRVFQEELGVGLAPETLTLRDRVESGEPV
jgi:LuxR family transcriptional regulator, maltose regulon positive regulatory protein